MKNKIKKDRKTIRKIFSNFEGIPGLETSVSQEKRVLLNYI
jgi:hypothetical protein